MTENPIVKMANAIRAKVGTTKKFTLPEIALLMELSTSFPDFSTNVTVSKNGSSQAMNSTISVNDGDTIQFTFNYTAQHGDLLRKLKGTNAKLSFSLPVIKYMDSNFTNKATSQTIHILRQDGSNLIEPTTIENGNTQYQFSNLFVNQQLTDPIVDYLLTNQPITVKYDNVYDNVGVYNLRLICTATLNLWIFQN